MKDGPSGVKTGNMAQTWLKEAFTLVDYWTETQVWGRISRIQVSKQVPQHLSSSSQRSGPCKMRQLPCERIPELWAH
jgi:hypothetical protein